MSMKGLIMCGGAASAILAMGTLATTYGIPLPALSSDIVRIQARIDDVDQLATQEALAAAQLRFYQNQREQQTVKDLGQPVPDYLLKEQVALEQKKRNLERRLKQ